jgi:hypothetical protein
MLFLCTAFTLCSLCLVFLGQVCVPYEFQNVIILWLLQGPQGKLNKTLLIARLKRLVDENKLEAIKNLVEAGKGTVDMAPIYMLMLQLYSM